MIKLQKNDPFDGTFRDLLPDLTPMLDILFILLVFFMLTAGSIFHSLELVLPSNPSSELSIVNKPKHIMLEISKDSYAIDGKQVNNFDLLEEAIQQAIAAKPDQEILIASDKDISIEQFLKVMNFLHTQGIETANVLMKTKDQ